MLPKFSLRIILILVTSAAMLSAVLARAVAGDAWAIAVSAAFVWAGFAMLVHAVFYVAASALSGIRAAHADVKEPSQSGEGSVV